MMISRDQVRGCWRETLVAGVGSAVAVGSAVGIAVAVAVAVLVVVLVSKAYFVVGFCARPFPFCVIHREISSTPLRGSPA